MAARPFAIVDLIHPPHWCVRMADPIIAPSRTCMVGVHLGRNDDRLSCSHALHDDLSRRLPASLVDHVVKSEILAITLPRIASVTELIMRGKTTRASSGVFDAFVSGRIAIAVLGESIA